MDSRRRVAGCTLSEALLACAFSAAALGCSGALQRYALLRVQHARALGVAMLQGASMAALLASNRSAWQESDVVRAAARFGATGACVRHACSANALAAVDLARWHHELRRVLPGARGSVSCVPSRCVVEIAWPPRQTLRLQVGPAPKARAAPAGGRRAAPGGTPCA